MSYDILRTWIRSSKAFHNEKYVFDLLRLSFNPSDLPLPWTVGFIVKYDDGLV